MIVPVDETNLLQAATIHSISWKESHRAFCTPDFIETHTPDRQREYLRNKMNNGTKLYMLVEEKPIGVVSVTKGLIEDLYILPDMQNMGYGTKLLLYAVGQCTDTPTLWILENNITFLTTSPRRDRRCRCQIEQRSSRPSQHSPDMSPPSRKPGV